MLRLIVSSLTSIFALSACSVWQNASRKYMEKQSYDLAGLKLHEENFVDCGQPNDRASWAIAPHDERAGVFTREREGHFELRVEPAIGSALACDYTFTSAEERAAATEVAIQNALDRFDHP